MFHYNHLPTPWFKQLHFLEKCIYLCISGVVTRGKFYAVWKLSESTALVSGIGYTIDKDGKDVFNFAENVDILGYEGGSNVKVMTSSWNKFTANWLRRYVYIRTKNPNLKLAVTFFVSAIWHGFYRIYLFM
jgi:lysophospholipid acyltransferase